jgi:hypothetical protein
MRCAVCKAVSCDTLSRYRSSVYCISVVMPVESPVARTAIYCIHNSAVVSGYLGASLLVLCHPPYHFTQEPYGAKSTLSCPVQMFSWVPLNLPTTLICTAQCWLALAASSLSPSGVWSVQACSAATVSAHLPHPRACPGSDVISATSSALRRLL